MTDTRKVDHGTVTHLEQIKFLQNNLLAAHTVWVNDSEVIYLFLFIVNSLNICKSHRVVLACTTIYKNVKVG